MCMVVDFIYHYILRAKPFTVAGLLFVCKICFLTGFRQINVSLLIEEG